MDLVLLQRFLRAEASGGLLLAGFSAPVSLYKASDPGQGGGRPSPSPALVDVSGSKEQHGVGSQSVAAAESGGRGGRPSRAGLHESVGTWPWEGEHLGDSWVLPHKPSRGCFGLRSLVFGGPDVRGRSPLLWGLFWSFSLLFCTRWTSFFAIPSGDCPWAFEQGIGMALDSRGFTALTSCSGGEGGRDSLRPGEGIKTDLGCPNILRGEADRMGFGGSFQFTTGRIPRGKPVFLGRGHCHLGWI